jgi:hypothetical protein
MAQVIGRAAEILAAIKLKDKDRGESIHPLIRDPVLRNLVVLWPLLPVVFNPGKVAAPEDENSQWLWLWEQVEYDKPKLADSLRLERMKLTRLIDRASSFHLIYPDGSASTLATQYIRGEIAKSLVKKPGPSSSPSSP